MRDPDTGECRTRGSGSWCCGSAVASRSQMAGSSGVVICCNEFVLPSHIAGRGGRVAGQNIGSPRITVENAIRFALAGSAVMQQATAQ
jgi:hypothetical protein